MQLTKFEFVYKTPCTSESSSEKSELYKDFVVFILISDSPSNFVPVLFITILLQISKRNH